MLSALLIALLTGVLLITFVWLVVVAFRQHVGWGLAVFFLSPLAAILFAIMHWQEARKPFLIYLVAAVVQIGAVVNLFVSAGGMEMMTLAERMQNGEVSPDEAAAQVLASMERMHRMGLLSDEDLAEARRAFEAQQAAAGAGRPLHAWERGVPAAQVDRQAEAPAPDPAPQAETRPAGVTTAVRPARTPRPVPVAEAQRYVGRDMRVTAANGVEHQGTLAAVRGNRLLFERRVYGGAFSFELAASEIRSLLVMPE